MTANKKTPTDSLQVDEAQVQLLLARRQALAENLHGCTSRIEAQRILADLFAADEATQMALLKTLARTHDSAAADAARRTGRIALLHKLGQTADDAAKDDQRDAITDTVLGDQFAQPDQNHRAGRKRQ